MRSKEQYLELIYRKYKLYSAYPKQDCSYCVYYSKNQTYGALFPNLIIGGHNARCSECKVIRTNFKPIDFSVVQKEVDLIEKQREEQETQRKEKLLQELAQELGKEVK